MGNLLTAEDACGNLGVEKVIFKNKKERHAKMSKIYTADEILESFVLEMIEEKGVAEEQKESKKAELLEKLNQEIDRSLVSALPDEELEKLGKIVDEDDGDEVATEKKVHALFYGSGVDFREVVKRVIEDFREKYLKEEA